MPKPLQILALAFLLASVPAASATCEADLNAEFSRPPIDANDMGGFVTDQIPITPENVIAAYQRGIFPWSVTSTGNGKWFSPPERGVLYFDSMTIPRSALKAVRQMRARGQYEVRFNSDFRQVMERCRQQIYNNEHEVNGEKKTTKAKSWITPEHIEAYTELNRRGLTHSVEVWRDGKMVGGLYGVLIGGYFSGESMFHDEDDVTKLAYVMLIEKLQESGHYFIDTQQVRGLNAIWGATEISRDEFRRLIAGAKGENLKF